MKKFITGTILAGLMTTGVAQANPFSDIKTDHWAYGSLNTLTEAGILQGYPNGTFSGNKAMTRYEMAEAVAKAMAYEEKNNNKISAENKATIDKLATEFKGELNNLGVRVKSLEDRVGNIKFTGDIDIRNRSESHEGIDLINFNTQEKHKYWSKSEIAYYLTGITTNNSVRKQNTSDVSNNGMQARVRINAEAKLNKNLSANVRFTTYQEKIKDYKAPVGTQDIGESEFHEYDGEVYKHTYNNWAIVNEEKYNHYMGRDDYGSSYLDLSGNKRSSTVKMDRYYIDYHTDNLRAILGKADAQLGEGLFLGNKALAGVQIEKNIGKNVNFKVLAGSFDSDDTAAFMNAMTLGAVGDDNRQMINGVKLAGAELAYNNGKFNIGINGGRVNYGDMEQISREIVSVVETNSGNTFWGANMGYNFGNKVRAFGEFYRTNSNYNWAKNYINHEFGEIIIGHERAGSTININPENKDKNAYMLGLEITPSKKFAFDVAYGKVGAAAVIPGVSKYSDILNNPIFNTLGKSANVLKVGANYKMTDNCELYANYWRAKNNYNPLILNSYTEYHKFPSETEKLAESSLELMKSDQKSAKSQIIEVGMRFKF